MSDQESWENKVRRPLKTPLTTTLVNEFYDSARNLSAELATLCYDQTHADAPVNRKIPEIAEAMVAGFEHVLYGVSKLETRLGLDTDQAFCQPSTFEEVERTFKDTKHSQLVEKLLHRQQVPEDIIPQVMKNYTELVNDYIHDFRTQLQDSGPVKPLC